MFYIFPHTMDPITISIKQAPTNADFRRLFFDIDIYISCLVLIRPVGL